MRLIFTARRQNRNLFIVSSSYPVIPYNYEKRCFVYISENNQFESDSQRILSIIEELLTISLSQKNNFFGTFYTDMVVAPVIFVNILSLVLIRSPRL